METSTSVLDDANHLSSTLSILLEDAQRILEFGKVSPNLRGALANALALSEKLSSVLRIATTTNPVTDLKKSSTLRRSKKPLYSENYETLRMRLTSSSPSCNILEPVVEYEPPIPPTPPPLPTWRGIDGFILDFGVEGMLTGSEDKDSEEDIESGLERSKCIEEAVENERQLRIKEYEKFSKGLVQGSVVTDIVKSIKAESDASILDMEGPGGPPQRKSTAPKHDDICPGEDQIWKIVDKFRFGETLEEILKLWDLLKQSCKIQPGDNIYEKLKEKTKDGGPFWCKQMWQLFDKKKNHPDYKNSDVQQNHKVIVIGGGPAGLSTAIECAIMGASVILIEKRDYISRNNILHLWPYTMEYLKGLSAKTFYTKFGTGTIDHIGTKQIQRLLLKIALMFGVHVYYGTVYLGSKKSQDGTYHVETNNPNLVLPTFNLLIAADGERSCVAKEFGFARKEFVGSLSIGITFNFVNHHTSEEVGLREFGISKQFCQQFFRVLLSNYDIDLENLVYYRGETHYFVMTAKKESLRQRCVFKQDFAETSQLISSQNINMSEMLSYIRDVANYVGIPSTCEVVTSSLRPDVAIFDFTRRLMADEAAKSLSETGNQFVALAGDALLEPFWPLGTGCNRALLSAMDSAWMLREIGKKIPSDKIVQNRFTTYMKMKNALSGSINQPYHKCTLEPTSRYGTGKEFHGVN